MIVNLSSVAARHGGGIGGTIYAAAKSSVACFTKGLARELAPQGIRANAISLGSVDNHFHQVFSTKPMLDSMLASTPAGRLGDNHDIAEVIVFLCSDAARYIHGQTFRSTAERTWCRSRFLIGGEGNWAPPSPRYPFSRLQKRLTARAPHKIIDHA